MNAKTDQAATAIAKLDAEIDQLQAERDALIAAAAPSDEGDPAKTAAARQSLARRLFGVRLPAGTERAQVAAFAATTGRFDDLADELAALGVHTTRHRWQAGGCERTALEWQTGGTTYSLHTPQFPREASR